MIDRKLFVAIYCEEATTAVDIMNGMTAQSARQEFLGCVFDLKQRIAASAENSVTVYKQVIFQISEEYQVRMDDSRWEGIVIEIEGRLVCSESTR